MALCAVCLSVPFASLPEPLAHAGFFRIGDNSDLPVLTFRPSDNDAVRHDSEGFPWHADLGALASSAQSCAICTIVQTGVEQWMEQRETALQNKFYVVFSDTHGYPIPTENRLILTKRSGGAPGFLVYVKSTHRGETTAPLLTGVAFSVAASKSLNEKQRAFDINSLTMKSARIGTNHTCSSFGLRFRLKRRSFYRIIAFEELPGWS